MPNKHMVKGKYDEVVGKITDDKGRELKGRAEHKYGHMKDKAQHKMDHMKDMDMDMDMDVDQKSVISMIVGFTLIVSGLYFVIRAIDEMS